MKNKDFREIQVSSSLLVVIFLGVLALGVFIFLLGVSVGKKQIAAAVPTEIVTQQIPEPVKEPPLKPAPSDRGVETPGPSTALPAPGGSETAAGAPSGQATGQPAATKAAPPKPAGGAKKPSVSPPSGSGLYFVQVAAFTTRAQAEATAEKYRDQGYTVVVTDPKPNDTKTWHRVRLGGYATRDKAVTLLAKLNAAAGKKTDFRVVQD